MKKLLAFALSFLMVLGVLPLTALTAHAVIVDSGVCGAEGDGSNLIWTLDDAGTLTISGTGEMKDYNYSSPPMWKGDSVKELVIISGVTSIGTFAFDSCTGLKSVTIPDSLTSIKFSAFGGCSSLVSVTIPDSVTYLGGGAFEHCYSLESVSIGKGITTITNYAFRCCEKLTEVAIPNSMTNIDMLAFYGCKSLTHVVIPNTVTHIGIHAIPENTVIYGYAGSYAQQWSKDNNRVFRLLEELVGDLNTDGKLGSDDARLALRASVGLEDLQPGTPAFIAADANKDGQIGSDDARLILRASVGLEQLA